MGVLALQPLAVKSEEIPPDQIEREVKAWAASIAPSPKRTLLLPPDFTRSHSRAGLITRALFDALSRFGRVDIMPALGTHAPMTGEELVRMFGPGIPADRFIVHNWRRDVAKIGEVPAEFVEAVSDGAVRWALDVEVNRRLLDPSYDRIISIGQVVPHEVAGMANYTKNILVGCGGDGFIQKTHFLGAVYGLERIMGHDRSPVRRVFDYAQDHFLAGLPLAFVFTVIASDCDGARVCGVYAGEGREIYEEAVKLSQEKNIVRLREPIHRAVVYLDPDEFKSTWLGNKAIYRTRMALAPGAELIIIAPGLTRFGEDPAIDRLIRQFGYCGTRKVLDLVGSRDDLRENLAAAAHLIHGSSEGRFTVTYVPGHLTSQEITGVHYRFLSLSEALERYNPATLTEGVNALPGGEQAFFIRRPGLGMWTFDKT